MLKYAFCAKTIARAAVMFAIMTMTTGCATIYLDNALKDVAPAEKAIIANPQPVQLMFEFQTKGVTNAKATDAIKKQVWDTVRASGLFSDVQTGPVNSGALLHISLNNVVLTENAYAKGFATGLTLGLAGNTVGDGYICIIDYQAAKDAPRLSKETRNAIYAAMGSDGPPAHSDKMSGLQDAIETMTKRTVAHALNELAKDPTFGK